MSLRIGAILVAAAVGTPLPTAAAPATSRSSPAANQTDYVPLSSGSEVQDQNFYLLTVLTQVPEYRSAMTRSTELSRIKAKRSLRVSSLLGECGTEDAKCRIEAMLWQPDEIASIGDALAGDRLLAHAATRHLRPSGAFARYSAKSDADLVRTAWSDAAAAMNRIYRVYGLAEAPRYPAIDSGDFNPLDAGFGRLLAEAADTATLGTTKDAPVFSAPLEFALTLLYLNERELVRTSSRLEILENAPVAARAGSIDWRAYPFASILVLGNGPNAAGTRIGNFGKLRVMRAAQLFREHKAPFIIVSGGAVHPAHTTMIEAVEMKRELIGRYGVPADAIILEPAARHTTTNFRNAVRLTVRYGLPMDKPSLVTSSRAHIVSVAADGFRVRLDKELGYQPITRGRQLGQYELEFRPLPTATHRDPSDPLDP